MQGWRLRQREIVAIFVFWMAVATLSAVNRLLDPRGGGLRFMSPAGPIVLGYVEALMWAALTPAIFFISAWALRGRLNVVIRAAALLAAGLLIAFVANSLLDFVRFELFQIPRRRPRMITPLLSFRVSFLNQLIVYAGVLAAGFAREYSERDRLRKGEAERLATETAQLHAQLAEARLQALRMQLDPHFLFNTLHAMSALVERDPAGVRRMIARLSDLLRYTLDTAATDEVPLRNELGFARQYIEIMNIRFQGKLKTSEKIDPAVEDARVPSLILQPLVENAIKHGVTKTRGSGTMTLSATRDGDRLVIAVEDDGPGPGEVEGDSGIGLANTRERLRQMYGDAGTLALRARAEGGTVAEVAIPYRTEAATR